MKQLDQLFILPQINVLKIDVEGYELFVLQGAKQNLDHCQFIYFEYSEQNANKYNYHAKELIAFLKSAGFLIYIPFKNGTLLELKEFDPLNNIGEQNLLALKDIALLRNKSIILK